MKLTQRIILIVILPLIISTLVSAAIISEITSEQFFKLTISKVQALSKLTESEMRNPMDQLDVDALNEIVDNLEEDQSVLQVLVLFPDGRLLTDGTDYDFNYGTTFEDEFIQNAITSNEEEIMIENDMIRISNSIILNERIGILIIDYSTNSIENSIQETIIEIIAVAGIIVGISIFVAVILSRSISNPILKIKENVNNITRGNLQRTKIQTKIPEINNLYDEILSMGDKIEKYQNELVKRERLITVGEMSARITHDLRNPLTAIKNAIVIMKMKNPGKIKENQQYFDMIQDAVTRMNHQIDEVLAFVKAKEPERNFVEFSEIINDVLKTISTPKNIKISILDNNEKIWCDKIQLQNVLINIISNSIQAIGNNEGKITINFKVEDKFDKITVKDNGHGIPENLLDTIFEPLYTTKQDGTGLGLVSCKNTIEAHNGRIYAQNSEEGGAIFTILLPKIKETK
ncbi:ATP-binding protein [Nitrosopumilus sp.]|uniref:sensor histidine kinase n=1 Tax=Nitrosopumilus sp. TaxID=2024843 RepID=UPI003D12E254